MDQWIGGSVLFEVVIFGWILSAHHIRLLGFVQIQQGHDLLDVLPYGFFLVGISQQVGGVVCGHEFDAVVSVEPAAQSGNGRGGIQQGLRRK